MPPRRRPTTDAEWAELNAWLFDDDDAPTQAEVNELIAAALRKAQDEKDMQIQQLIHESLEAKAQIERLEADMKAERYAKETAYQNGEM